MCVPFASFFFFIVSGLLESHLILSSGKGGRRNQTLACNGPVLQFALCSRHKWLKVLWVCLSPSYATLNLNRLWSVNWLTILREEARCVLAGLCGSSILVELEFGDVGFCEGKKTREPGEKSWEYEANQQPTQPKYDTRNRSREASVPECSSLLKEIEWKSSFTWTSVAWGGTSADRWGFTRS